jgi:hypothetical protein
MESHSELVMESLSNEQEILKQVTKDRFSKLPCRCYLKIKVILVKIAPDEYEIASAFCFPLPY